MSQRSKRFMAVAVVPFAALALGSNVQAQGGRTPCWVQGDASGVGRRPSPLDSTSVALDGGTIKVCYGRPSARGRKIMGELVPYGAPWRLGANEATAIYLPFAARIAGTAVSPGWYSLYVIPEAAQWRVVVNREAQRWGVPINEAVRAKDVGSGVVSAERLPSPVDKLAITLRRTSNTAATMDVEWESTRVRVPVEKR